MTSSAGPPAERVAVQGSADLMMGLCAAAGGFASGFIRRAVGYHMLANLAALAAGVLLVATSLANSRWRGDQRDAAAPG